MKDIILHPQTNSILIIFSTSRDRWDWDILFVQKENINLNNLKA